MALLLFVLPAVAALMAKQSGAGKGMSRGKGVAPRRGVVFQRDGPHARDILSGWLKRDSNYLTWDAFLKSHKTWLLSANGTGYYMQQNLNRNYHAVIKRYQKHIDPNDPYDGNYPAGMLAACGAPGLPDNNPPGLNFAPGDANANADAAEPELPRQIPTEPPAEEEEEEEEEEEASEEEEEAEETNSNLAEAIDELVEQVSTFNMSEANRTDTIPTIPFHAPHVKVKGVNQHGISNVEGLVCLLGGGVDLGSLDVELAPDRQRYKVKAIGANEMTLAAAMLPPTIQTANQFLWEPLRQALQEMLIRSEKDPHTNRPIYRGRGKLHHKVTSEGALTLDRLYLAQRRYDRTTGMQIPVDTWMIHKVHFDPSIVNTTVPSYIAMCFFLQEIDQGPMSKPTFIRTLPDSSPPPAVLSPGSNSNKRRNVGSIGTIRINTNNSMTGISPLSIGHGQQQQGQQQQQQQGQQGQQGSPFSVSSFHSSNQAQPDQQPSGGFFNFGRR